MQSDSLCQLLDDFASPSVQLLVIKDVIAYLPLMEQHLCIGCNNQPYLCLFYFRTDRLYECIKIRFLYVGFLVAHIVMIISTNIVIDNYL